MSDGGLPVRRRLGGMAARQPFAAVGGGGDREPPRLKRQRSAEEVISVRSLGTSTTRSSSQRTTPMRDAILLVLVAGPCLPILAQTTGFTLREYLAPQYTAPKDAPSTIVIAGSEEPGERLIVTGRTLDAAKPVSGVSLYVFHTDTQGRYAPGMDQRTGEFNPRLHGELRTDAQGRYQYETTRPGSYDDSPAHVHYVVSARGYKPLLLSLQFEDDPIVIRMRSAGRPLLDPAAFRNGPCKSRPDCVLTQPVARDAQGVSHVVRDIQMVRE